MRSSGAQTLVTVRSFLGVDYPALLHDEDVGAAASGSSFCGRDGADSGRAETGSRPDRRPAAFLADGQSVTPSATAARAADVKPDDVSDLIFTSGTTGYPKGAATTHAQSLRTFGTWSSIVGLAAGDRYLVVNPFFHTFGYKAGILACLMAGATVVPEPVFDAAAVMQRIARERISVLPGPPTLYQALLADPGRAEHDLSSLRLGVTGAAVVPVELVQAMRDELGFGHGPDGIRAHRVLRHRHDVPPRRSRRDVATTSGRAIPGLEVRTVVDGQAAPTGEPGEIVVRGYTVMSGYWGNEAATAEAIDADGWLHTGDVGVMDEAGNVTITDRVKDMYVVGGFNAYPAEIEAILRTHEGVAQVAVVGRPRRPHGGGGLRLCGPGRRSRCRGP